MSISGLGVARPSGQASGIRYDLASRAYAPSRSVPGFSVLIQDDLRRCVVFIGTKGDAKRGGIECCGTGFLLEYKTMGYLVTAQHVAVGLGDDPYLIRLNKLNGEEADNISIDPLTDGVRWYVKPDDPDLDLAVMPFMYGLAAGGYEGLFVPQKLITGEVPGRDEILGIGDTCYTIGLFQLFAGTKRNLPVVHRGSIALMAGQEPVPVEDWHAPRGSGKTRHVNCHLVETQSLQGLSGAPVFSRASFDIDLPVDGTNERATVRVAKRDMCLFGIWQGSWDAPPGQVFSVPHRQGTRVPVGMGCVVPARKLIDLLESDDLRTHREEAMRKKNTESVASLDSVPRKPDTNSSAAERDDPHHFSAGDAELDYTAMNAQAAKEISE